ncbi:hypothetical protein IEU95_09720 [Hoyosella rhizosphaerae]|uniref:hypothetical protein n=1 Tax=Hoyosella rhizosphaerae TaxID=1755582 RepID=UPI00166D7DC6|nr:hypothetical protein [Hoyosella rhizosphaerae]MBN4927110.1 hypothetical protein [Hoyosella rhizosphaerae]
MRGLFKLVFSLAVILVIVAAASEAATRYFVGKDIRDPLSESWQSSVSTSFGFTPLLPALLDDRIADLSIDSGTIGTGTLRGSTLLIDLSDVNISDRENPVAGTVEVTAQVATDTIFEAIQAQGGGGVALLPGVTVSIDGVTAHPDRDALAVEMMGGTASVDMVPRINGGDVVVDIGQAQILGLPLPSAIAQAIQGGATEPVAALPDSLRADSVRVTDYGVEVRLVGDNVPLSDLQ